METAQPHITPVNGEIKEIPFKVVPKADAAAVAPAPKPRTREEIQAEYSNLCGEIGHMTVQIAAWNLEIAKKSARSMALEQEVRAIVIEEMKAATKARVEAQAKAAADKAAAEAAIPPQEAPAAG